MATLVQNANRIKGGAEEIKKILLAEGKTPGLIETFAPLLAESIVDTPTEQLINGTRATASGASIDKGIAVLKGLRGKANKVVQLCQSYQSSESDADFVDGVKVTFDGYKVILDVAEGGCTATRYKHIADYKFNVIGASGHKRMYFGMAHPIEQIGLSTGYNEFPINTILDNGYNAVYFILKVLQGCPQGRYVITPMVLDLTAMGLENCNTADEVAKALGYASIADVPYIPYTEGEILVSKPSRLISKDADGDVLDSLAITLPSLFADGILSVGDVADEWGTKATKRVGKRAYQSGDESDTSVLTDGTITLYELATPIEEQTPFPIGFYKAEPNGTEEVQDAESNPTLLDGFIGYEGMDTIANLASAWGIDADKVGKVIVTGKENWQLADGGYYAGLFVLRIDALPIGNTDGRGSAIPYKGWNNANPTGMPDGHIIGPSGYYASAFFTSGIRDSRFASLDAWKTHLADLYASGCPLTIYYEKA